MQAVLWTDYGAPEVLQVASIERPRPAADEILVKIAAANIFTGDCEMRRFKMHPSLWLPIRLYMGILKPRIKILGQEFSGTVIATGAGVAEFEAGDEVYGNTGSRFSAYADYVALPARFPIVKKPSGISHTDASTISVGGQHALHFLRLAELRDGERLLVYGACGCIGTYVVQLAKQWGAEVTAVDSADKLETLHAIGADHVIDYRQEDFTSNEQQYDVIFDVVGLSPYGASLQRLRPDGRYILANVGLLPMLRAAWRNRRGSQKIITKLARATKTDLREFEKYLETGAIRAVIDRTFPLAEAAAAHRYIDAGKKQGHVVLLPGPE